MPQNGHCGIVTRLLRQVSREESRCGPLVLNRGECVLRVHAHEPRERSKLAAMLVLLLKSNMQAMNQGKISKRDIRMDHIGDTRTLYANIRQVRESA